MAAPHELDQHSNRLIDFPALSCELQKSTVYPEFSGWMGSTALLPAAFNGIKYVDAAHLLATSDTPALRAIGLCTIARSFYDKEGEVAMYEGKGMGVQELCLEALRCDPSSPMAYTFLGFLSDPSTGVLLPDGRTLNRRQLYLEALRCNPSFTNAFCNLGTCLSVQSHETVLLPDGRTMNKQQLYLEALRCDSSCFFAYNNLGVWMSADEAVALPDGRTLNKRQLYVETLRLNTNYSFAYCNLGACLSKGEIVELHDGRILDRRSLFLEALRCNSNYSNAYRWLAFCLSADESVTLPDGRSLNVCDLYLEALRCNPKDANVKSDLLKSLPMGRAWNRYTHSLVFGTMMVNVLFATLLLGLQRLETDGVLPPAHHSMLEDMLEGWTWGDMQVNWINKE